MKSSLLLLLFFLHPFLSLSHINLDSEHNITFKLPSGDNSSKNPNSYFGYSVLLYSRGLIVGAPNAHYTWMNNNNKTTKETGAVYRCSFIAENGSCAPINVNNPAGDSLNLFDRFPTTIETEFGGIGATLSGWDDFLTVCAPRTTLLVHDEVDNDKIVVQTMHGVCYNGQLSSGNISIEDPDFTTYNFSSDYYYNPSIGFAVHYPGPQKNLPIVSPIIGSPFHEGTGTVHEMGKQSYIAIENYIDERHYSLFGYAVTSGYYFNRSNLMVAGGAPRSNFGGQVGIMNYNSNSTEWSAVQMINGTDYQEFFGASLATGDLNNDGLDDLIVGAPHWNNDNGKVYIYMGNKSQFSKADAFLEGKESDALFGYAMTSGDLDKDGYDDFIVAAPWEGSGVIYIFSGHAEFGKKSVEISLSQKIVASSDTRGFGFSLSNIYDVNGDGSKDVAVGAYASGNVRLFLSIACVKSEIKLETQPLILSPNAEGFVLKICVNGSSYRENNIVTLYLFVKFWVDKINNRALMSQSPIKTKQRYGCESYDISLKVKNISNYVDDIEIIAELECFTAPAKFFAPMNYCRDEMTCPDPTKHVRMKLPFKAPADIWAKLEFPGLSDSTYIIGSNNLSLVLIIRNNGYSAYSTNVTFCFPEGVLLRRILSSCHEIRESRAMRVTCDVGNPLEKAMEKNITLDLDVSKFDNVLSNGTKLDFSADIRTRSVNEGMSTVTSPSLQLNSDVSIALSGKVYNKIINFGHDKVSSKLNFNHNYEIARFGITPISEVLLKILVPYKIKCLRILTISRIVMLGHVYKCPMSDVLSKEKLTNDKISTEATAENRSQCDDEISVPSYKQLKLANGLIIYLNCSSPNVTCEQVTCAIPFSGTISRNVRLQVELTMDIFNLTEAQANDKKITIHFASEASAHVQNSKMQFNISGTGIPISLTSTFYRIPKEHVDYSIFNNILKAYDLAEKDIDYRIILGSILLGLLILGLIICLLKYMGFFKRTRREYLEILKKHKETEMDTYIRSDGEEEGHDVE